MTAHLQGTLIQRLERLLQSGPDPDVATQGARLIKRLKGPVQIAVIGRAGSGKSRLVDLLALQTALPVLEISEISLAEGLAQLSEISSPANIVLWCCQAVDIAELAIWSKMPAVIKDHSFLILTKADRLAAAGQLNPMLDALEISAAEEFHSLFPLATLLAITASGASDGPAFQASGAARFLGTLQHLLRLDRGDCRDSAAVFLKRHEKPGGTLATPPKIAGPQVAAIWARPAEYLQERANQMRQAQSLPLADKIQTLLDHCCDTAEGLAELLRETAGLSVEDTARFNEILVVADTTVLLRIEGTANAAADALALLLQLRRDFSLWSNV